MFSTSCQTNFAMSATFKTFSANAFNLDKSNNLLFGDELQKKPLFPSIFMNYKEVLLKQLIFHFKLKLQFVTKI